MAYSDFTLSGIKKQFQLSLVERMGIFDEIEPRQPSALIQEILLENLPLALASNTEKARSEMIISPILIELRKQLDRKISIFSGVNFTIDIEKGLTGNCDFLISQSPELFIITAPVVTVVEAKKEDLNAGLGQCVAEMIAARIFNARENSDITIIYGVITSGTNWRFLKLEDSSVLIDLKEYYLDNLGEILGILAHSLIGSESSS